jgi:hypothetical protein
MTVMAEELTRKLFDNNQSAGSMTALRNVGDLLNNRMTVEEFNGITNHIVSAQANGDIPSARKDFNKGYLEMLGTLMEI